MRWRSWKLRREKQHLEQVIRERTKEIAAKNRQLEFQASQLEKQTVQLKEQSVQLEEMNRVKSRFFANISHEFRTPLTLIMGPLEQILFKRRGTDKELEKDIDLALRNSRRLLRLINRLLELSKFDSGMMKLHASQQDIVPFLKGILHSFDSLAAQRDIRLIFQTGAEGIILYYDPEKLEEVIANLLSNAAKFTPAGGKITLAVREEEAAADSGEPGWVEISVTDTGPGIPPGQLAYLFDRFFQADSTREHHREGSGIGLAIAKEIVGLHRGTILAHNLHDDSDNTSGARFVLRLPRGVAHLLAEEISDSTMEPGVPQDRQDRQVPPTLPVTPAMQDLPVLHVHQESTIPPEEAAAGEITVPDETKETGDAQEKDIILVVEDSAEVRDYIRGALVSHYTVMGAKDGNEGIRMAGEIIPDLIICDVMMPGIDGIETCRALKSAVATSHIPIILLTAKAGEENILRGLESGADDYITKPFSTRILCARIKNLVELRRQLQLSVNRAMTKQPVQVPVSPIDREFLKELQEVIEKNLSDSDFNVEQLCKKLYMSGATLYRKIRALSGESPTDFIRSYRLQRAAQLLKSGFGSVTEVAFEVGFSSRAYFTKCFKEKFQQLPSSYHPGAKSC